MNKKEIIAVLLAGGKGSRLEPLTKILPSLPCPLEHSTGL